MSQELWEMLMVDAIERAQAAIDGEVADRQRRRARYFTAQELAWFRSPASEIGGAS